MNQWKNTEGEEFQGVAEGNSTPTEQSIKALLMGSQEHSNWQQSKSRGLAAAPESK